MSNDLMDIGKCAYESIEEMVKALDVDYDRLQDLRDDIKVLEVEEIPEAMNDVAAAEDEDDRQDWQSDLDELLSRLDDLKKELAELEADAGDCESEDDAIQRIDEDPLEVSVRSDWHAPGDGNDGSAEYLILLGTGGPATRIVGDLDMYYEPCTAVLEVQDWGTPWTPYHAADEDVLLRYARHFYYGE
jgi:hypothetical protein